MLISFGVTWINGLSTHASTPIQYRKTSANESFGSQPVAHKKHICLINDWLRNTPYFTGAAQSSLFTRTVFLLLPALVSTRVGRESQVRPSQGLKCPQQAQIAHWGINTNYADFFTHIVSLHVPHIGFSNNLASNELATIAFATLVGDSLQSLNTHFPAWPFICGMFNTTCYEMTHDAQ